VAIPQDRPLALGETNLPPLPLPHGFVRCEASVIRKRNRLIDVANGLLRG
jgi:hypothetical protein